MTMYFVVISNYLPTISVRNVKRQIQYFTIKLNKLILGASISIEITKIYILKSESLILNIMRFGHFDVDT